jgi:predicted Zn-dependent peptidase
VRPAILCILLLLPLTLAAQDIPDNPFGGFETWILPNGLKVWYKHMPGQPNVAVSVTVQVGSDADPVGKEQLAHFLEHMLFSDHLGLTTAEIKKQIEDRGGVWNGNTTADRTFYFAHIKKEHGLFALEWLYRIASPHEMKPEVVERERYPVEVEVGAKPREISDWLFALYVNPPLLRSPGIWKRQFNLATNESRDFYPFRSLRSITPEDLKAFYDRYYTPQRMTLSVIGDLPKEAVAELVEKTFATLKSPGDPPPFATAADTGRSEARFYWESRSNISYFRRFRFASLSADDDVMLVFIGEFLGKRLNDRLRFGEKKATYGISTGLIRRGPAGYFFVGGTIRESELDFATRVFNEEIEALRNGSLSDAAFEADRSVVVQQLRVTYSTPDTLESWVAFDFANRERHRDFPDLVSAFQSFTRAHVAAFVSRNFVSDREFNQTNYPLPISEAVLALLSLALVLGTVRVVRLLLTRPVDMKRIRYVAHFRMPRVLFWGVGAAGVVVVAVGFRLLAFAYEILSLRLLTPRDSFALQWGAYAVMALTFVALIVLALSMVPSKLLVFEDRLLIKYVAYRSVVVPLNEIAELSFLRFPAVWASRRLWKCLPLKWGIVSPGIYLKTTRGWSYFFDVRDRGELVKVLEEYRSSPAGPADT